jgi:hypothetical protein
MAVAESVLGPRPRGESEALRRVGDAWSAAGQWLRTQAESSVKGVTSGLADCAAGQAADEMGDCCRRTSTALMGQADYCESLAAQAYLGANSIELGQLTWDGMAIMTVTQLVTDALLLEAGAARAAADRAAASAGWRRFLSALLERLTRAGVTFTTSRTRMLVTATVMGGVANGAVALGAQLVQEVKGHRTRLDTASIVTETVSGAAGGLAGAALPQRVSTAIARNVAEHIVNPGRAAVVSTLLLGGVGRPVRSRARSREAWSPRRIPVIWLCHRLTICSAARQPVSSAVPSAGRYMPFAPNFPASPMRSTVHCGWTGVAGLRWSQEQLETPRWGRHRRVTRPRTLAKAVGRPMTCRRRRHKATGVPGALTRARGTRGTTTLCPATLLVAGNRASHRNTTRMAWVTIGQRSQRVRPVRRGRPIRTRFRRCRTTALLIPSPSERRIAPAAHTRQRNRKALSNTTIRTCPSGHCQMIMGRVM